MASVFISYSHTDREFVRRLAQDLTNQTVEVWLDEWRMAVGKDIKAVLDEGIVSYDFFLIVVSRASIASGWVRHELEIALEKERNGLSGFVLALLLERVPLPPLVGDRSPVDFTLDYAAGLTALIATLGHVTVKTEVDSARLRIITARRGIKTRSGVTPVDEAEGFTFGSGSSHRLSATTFVSETGAIQAVIQSTGDARVAIELTSEVAHLLRIQCNEHRITRHHDRITEIFRMVDVLAKMVNLHHRLSGLRWVACKLVLLIWAGDAATVAAVGTVGAMIDGEFGIAFENATYQAQFEKPPGPIDHSVVARFPLGYLVDGSLTLEPLDFRFVSGDAVALTSFALPANPDDVGSLTGQLSNAGDPLEVPRLLVESHWPPVDDAYVSLMYRDA